MDAPTCKLCGTRHYRYQLHVWPRGEVVAHSGGLSAPTPNNATAPVKAGADPKPKFDRNAYQREYMRRKRAAKAKP
jgi:hypothetical protein